MRGTIFDLIFVLVALIIIFIVVLFANLLNTEFSEATNATATRDAILNQTYFDEADQTFKVFDFGFAFLAIGMGLAAIVTAFLIKTHPIFYIASLLLLIVLIAVSAIFVNLLDEIATNAALIDEANKYPIMMFTMRNLPTILTVMGFISLAVVFAKGRDGR